MKRPANWLAFFVMCAVLVGGAIVAAELVDALRPDPPRPTCSDPAAVEVWQGPSLVCVPPR